MTKEKLVKIDLKLRKRHPRKSFRLGRHVVGFNFDSFELNEAEMKELGSKGCKAWIISKDELEALKKTKKAPANKEEK